MRSVYLGSVVEKSGKSMVTLGLAKNFQGQVGFFKPFKERLMRVGDRVIDQDAYLMRQVLGIERFMLHISVGTLPHDQVLRSIELVSLKKVQGQYIPRTMDYRDLPRRDKTRIDIQAAAMRVHLDPLLFIPSNLHLAPPLVESSDFTIF